MWLELVFKIFNLSRPSGYRGLLSVLGGVNSCFGLKAYCGIPGRTLAFAFSSRVVSVIVVHHWRQGPSTNSMSLAWPGSGELLRRTLVNNPTVHVDKYGFGASTLP